MKRILINIPAKTYPVFIGEGIFTNLAKLIENSGSNRHVFLLVDENVLNLHREKIEKFVNQYPSKLTIEKFNAAEKNKSHVSLNKIYESLIKNNFNRDTLLIALGGGITGDIAGFAASTYNRGIQFVQVPTTLLAAVDSSVGGKTGINFNEVKNIIGSFYQPEFVVIDANFFETLPDEEVICGIGEIIKYAFIAGEDFFKFTSKNITQLISRDKKITSKFVEECIKIKGSVVEQDEKESGLRKMLNFGHTFAHAFEIEQKHKIKHGQAVIVGIACALYLSNTKGILSDANLKTTLAIITKFKDFIKLNKCNIKRMLEIMQKDKKNSDGNINFVLFGDDGNILIDFPAAENEIINAVNKGISIFQ